MAASDAINRELFHGTHMNFKPGDLVLPISHTGAEPNTRKNLRINRNLAHATTDMGEAQEFAGKSALGRADGGAMRARVFQVEPVDADTLREKGTTVSTPYGFKVVKRVWTRSTR
jgi:hypothetical protein